MVILTLLQGTISILAMLSINNSLLQPYFFWALEPYIMTKLNLLHKNPSTTLPFEVEVLLIFLLLTFLQLILVQQKNPA